MAKDQPAAELIGHAPNTYVEHAVFSPDGRSIVTAGEDGTARVWDARTGKELSGMSPLRHSKFAPDAAESVLRSAEAQNSGLVPLNCARFSPRGDQIVTGCEDGSVRTWDVGKLERPRLIFQAHTEAVLYVAFSPDGSLLVTCSRDNTARLWDAATGRPIHQTRLTHGNWVYEASFSPDGRRLVTVSYDKLAKLWDVASGKLITRLQPKAPMCSVQFSPDGRYIAAACWDYDSTVRVWDVEEGGDPVVLLRHTGYPARVAYGPNGHQLAVVSTDGVIRLWDLAGNAWMPPAVAETYSADGLRYVSVRGQSLDMRTGPGGKEMLTSIDAGAPVAGAVLNPSGQSLLVAMLASDASETNLVARVWKADGQPIGPAFPLARDEVLVALSLDGACLVAATGRVARVWDTAKGELLHDVLHPDDVKGMSYSPLGHRFVSWAGTNAFLWDPRKGTLGPPLAHPSVVGHAEFSPDGRQLVTCCALGEFQQRFAEIWDGESGAPTGIRLWHSDGVNYASFSPDGRRIVTASEDRSARVWDRATGKQLTPPLVHPEQVREACFSPDGRWIATLSQDRNVRVWDAATGAPVTPGWEPGVAANWLQFLDNGSQVFCTHAELNHVRKEPMPRDWWVGDLQPDGRPVGQLVLVAQALSGRQGAEPGAGLPMQLADLKHAWLKLREGSDFRVSSTEVLAWHQREARICEQGGQWAAARFHLVRLANLLPGDTEVTERLRRAEAELASGRRIP
jgi:WD40 repeat protein